MGSKAQPRHMISPQIKYRRDPHDHHHQFGAADGTLGRHKRRHRFNSAVGGMVGVSWGGVGQGERRDVSFLS